MSSSIFNLIQRANEIEAQLIDSGGEIDGLIEKLQADLAEDVAAKAESYHHVTERLSHNAEFYRQRAKEMAAAASSLERVEKALKDTLKGGLIALGYEELKTESVRFKISPTAKRLVISDVHALPPQFKVVVYEADKGMIREALDHGLEVPGASLEGGFSLRTYVNKERK